MEVIPEDSSAAEGADKEEEDEEDQVEDASISSGETEGGSPQSAGTKDTASSAENTICNHPERPNSSLAFPTATMCVRPYNPHTNLQRCLLYTSDAADE